MILIVTLIVNKEDGKWNVFSLFFLEVEQDLCNDTLSTFNEFASELCVNEEIFGFCCDKSSLSSVLKNVLCSFFCINLLNI